VGAVGSRLRRWHVWLGWIIGLPILLWVVTGLVMVAKPIEEVRGEGLLAETLPLRLNGPAIPPPLAGVPLKLLELRSRASGPRWVITMSDGTTRLADATNGRLLPSPSAADAAAEVVARYTGTAKIRSVNRTDPAHPPVEFRRPIGAWQVVMDDGTHFYVDAGSGEVVARRTGWWRVYDFMWGLHIMDPQTREDTHNPWVIGFGILALVMTLLALVLLPMTSKRRRRARESAP
jgi:hypothetical protein